jgi:hypothetical protein
VLRGGVTLYLLSLPRPAKSGVGIAGVGPSKPPAVVDFRVGSGNRETGDSWAVPSHYSDSSRATFLEPRQQPMLGGVFLCGGEGHGSLGKDLRGGSDGLTLLVEAGGWAIPVLKGGRARPRSTASFFFVGGQEPRFGLAVQVEPDGCLVGG